MLPDLRVRGTEPELMDSPGTPFETHFDYLRDLERINALTLAYRPTLRWLERVVTRPASIIDIGSGGGGLLRILRRWGRRKGIRLALTGLDINPLSTETAQRLTPDSMDIRFETADLFTGPWSADYIVCTSFTHHLDDETLARFLRWLEARARRGWQINDLQRHILPYLLVKAGMRLFPVHPMARHDGPVSVKNAFTKQDWRMALEKVETHGAKVEWFFPFRYVVTAQK